MPDYHWQLHVPIASRWFCGIVLLLVIVAALKFGWQHRGPRLLLIIIVVVTGLVTGPVALDRVPEFIDLKGDTLSFNQGPFPRQDLLHIADIESIREAHGQRGLRFFVVTLKGSQVTKTMPIPSSDAETQKLQAALAARGIHLVRLPR